MCKKKASFYPNFLQALSLSLLLFYGFSVVIFSLHLLLKIYISKYILVISFILAAFTSHRQLKVSFFLLSLVNIIIIGLSVCLARLFFDTSWDGTSYHMDAIFALKDGWNPIYQYLHVFKNPDNTDLWTNYFAKSSWYFSSLMLKFFQNINVIKSGHFILSCSAGFYALSWLHRYNVKNLPSFLISILIIFNPVFLTQWASNYVDSAIYSLFLIALLSSSEVKKPQQYADKICFIFATALLATMKASGIVFGIVIGFVAIWGSFCRKKEFKQWIKSVIAIICLVIVMGISPYITNLLQGRSPLFPLLGIGSVDILTDQTNKLNISGFNKLTQLVISLTSVPANQIIPPNYPPAKTFLFPTGLPIFSTTDVRLSGWGPIFMEIFFFSLPLIIFGLNQKNLRRLFITLFLMILIFPAPWWARYSPMIYFLPLMGVAVVFIQKHKLLSYLAYFILFLLLINNILVGKVYFEENRRLTTLIKKVLAPLKAKQVDVCRDSRFHTDTYLSSQEVAVHSIFIDSRQCLNSDPLWQDLTPSLKIDNFRDRNSAWSDILAYFKVKITDSTANTIKLTKFYSFSEFQGLGHLYKFGFAGDAAKFLMSGWSNDRKSFAQTKGQSSQLLLIGVPSGLNVHLTVVMSADRLLNNELMKAVLVSVNGIPLATWNLSKEAKHYFLVIPKEVLAKKDLAVISFNTIKSPNKETKKDSQKPQLRIYSLIVDNPPPEC